MTQEEIDRKYRQYGLYWWKVFISLTVFNVIVFAAGMVIGRMIGGPQ